MERDRSAYLRAERPGEVPGHGAASVGGVSLPAGRPAEDVAVWCTDRAVEDAVGVAERLAERFIETGLWPILWTLFDEPSSYMYLDDDVADIEDVDVAACMEERWMETARLNRDYMLGPYAEPFPGMAPASEGIPARNPFSVYGAQVWSGPPEGPPYRLLLVACRRPADAISVAQLDFHQHVPNPITSAILRSWEDRFGASPVVWTPSTINLGVSAPPCSLEAARKLAGEINAVYPPGDVLSRSLDDQALALVDGPDARYDDVGRAPGVWLIGGD